MESVMAELDTQQVGSPGPVPAGPGAAPSASAFGRLFGFLLVLIAVYLGTMDSEHWNRLVTWGGQSTAAPAPQLEPLVGDWLRWCIALVCALGALSLTHAKPFSLLVAAGTVAVTMYGVTTLLEIQLSWRAIVLVAVALGYLIYSVPRPASASAVGIFGLCLTVLASLGAARGWFDWGPLLSRLGPGLARLASDWSEELSWLTVLLLSFLGVFYSRTRPIRFFIAVLLLVLAYHCVMAGRTEIRSFPGLAGPGGEQLTQPDVSYANVEAWRWVAAVECVLIAVVLLYKALGMGCLNVAFAIAWMFLGCGFYNSIRTLSLGRLVVDWTTASGTVQPFSNMGLPLADPAATDHNAGARTGSPTAGVNAPAQRLGARTTTAGAVSDAELQRARAAALASIAKQGTWRELVLPGWIYLTAILAGVIGVSGLRMLLGGEAGRAWMSYALWLGFGIGLAAAWFADPKESTQTWTSWLSDWTQSRHKLHIVWLIFVGTAAVAGSWALRPRSREHPWIQASIACAFAGTALSLIAVTILIHLGGFAPLPVWTYGAIAAGQSSLAWILLMYLSVSARKHAGTARA